MGYDEIDEINEEIRTLLSIPFMGYNKKNFLHNHIYICLLSIPFMGYENLLAGATPRATILSIPFMGYLILFVL